MKVTTAAAFVLTANLIACASAQEEYLSEYHRAERSPVCYWSTGGGPTSAYKPRVEQRSGGFYYLTEITGGPPVSESENMVEGARAALPMQLDIHALCDFTDGNPPQRVWEWNFRFDVRVGPDDAPMHSFNPATLAAGEDFTVKITGRVTSVPVDSRDGGDVFTVMVKGTDFADPSHAEAVVTIGKNSSGFFVQNGSQNITLKAPPLSEETKGRDLVLWVYATDAVGGGCLTHYTWTRKRSLADPTTVSLPQRLPKERFGARVVAGNGGVVITFVQPGSSAAKHGFEIGDTVLEINGQPIRNTQDYSSAVDGSGRQMQVRVQDRSPGKFRNVAVDLAH
jgi:hypothetical protein